jgi:protocatechuate 3,4-dioxygenase beta subunit
MLSQPRRVATAIVMVAVSIPAAAQVIPTDAAPPGQRTGMIVGQVVDAVTGMPVGEAIVRLTMPKYVETLPTTPTGRVMADEEGGFFFADLPPGEYYLQATKDGYAPGTYGQRRAWGQSQLVSLGEGERLADARLRLWKYGVITGTVSDEAGEPVVGITVRALMRDVTAGRTQYGNLEVIPELVPSAITDDRGMFRLSQLMPGTYVVLVPSTQTTLPVAALDGQDAALRSDLFFAGVAEVASPGQPRAQQMGDVALLTSSRVLIPPPPTAAGRMAVYPTTFFPAAPTAREATRIALQAGEERTDVAISLRPVPAVRVAGRVITPDGTPPPRTTIRLTGAAMTDVITRDLVTGQDYVGFETVTGMTDASGRFTLLGVPPGEYVLTHANAFLSRAIQQGQPAYWISQRITVGADDISNLIVRLRPALRVEGHVEFRSGSGPPPLMAGIMFETPFAGPGQFVVEVTNGARPSFSTVAAGGRYIVRPYEVGGWVVQSVTLDGKDITDRVIDLETDARSLVVTYTDRPSKVSGTVTDARGEASATAIVLAFPADERRWSGYGASPRDLASALTTRTGVYTFDHLPPGDYYVIAIDPTEADGWKDPSRLEALANEATKLTIAATDPAKTLDLHLKTVR